MTSYRVIGQPIPRTDGPEKVTGAARYTGDVRLPGTLWGKTLRSPYSHALITRIDTSRAKALSGVHAVLTGEDVRGLLYGQVLKDVPVLTYDRVRFIGERVAVVAAVDKDTAQQAVDLIEVEYEELPAVFDPEEALKEDAPLLHPDVNSYEGLIKPLEKPSNAYDREVWGRGDIAQGFAEADMVVENTFTTPRVHQSYLEPHTVLLWIDDEDRIQVWAANRLPHIMRNELALAIGVPEGRIRVNHAHIGGDFGGKHTLDEPLCYFLALRTGRPIKMVMDYTEEFMATSPRHASIVRLKTGIKRDGTLVACQAQLIFNSGAYAGHVALLHLVGAEQAAGPYKTPHVQIEAIHVYTNTVTGGYMRSPGESQATFASESHMDDIARRVGMTPLEFRMKNLIEEGDETLTGRRYPGVPAEGVKTRETLEAAAEAASYTAPKPPYVGRGIAVAERTKGGGQGHAAVTLAPDGSVVLHTPIFEQGSGSYTCLRQMVAEELVQPIERVQVEVWNTDAVPFDTGVAASRVTYIEGMAVYQAAQEARWELARLAAELLGWPEESISLDGEYVMLPDGDERVAWAGLLERAGRTITGRGSYLNWARSPVTASAAQVAEVSVDSETGEVRLLRFTTAHDVGTVLNPLGHQGQIEGGVIMGTGYALREELKVEEGGVTTLSFGDYKIANIKDVPPLQTVLVEAESGVGPYKIKWMGEGSLAPVAPAIANAIEDAVGVRIRDLPITAEKVYRALKAAKG